MAKIDITEIKELLLTVVDKTEEALKNEKFYNMQFAENSDDEFSLRAIVHMVTNSLSRIHDIGIKKVKFIYNIPDEENNNNYVKKPNTMDEPQYMGGKKNGIK